ncbi:GNAT family N-acetyltransferase [Streptomyces sp. SID13726]|uniref:GNAT family N-acetyltransferase n=1 Tax=Streptomyces sp. SID13726 TaxID=2706058 RepID=UPI0031BAD506
MDLNAVRLRAPATGSAPALVLRPWRPADAPHLAVLHRDGELRRWIRSVVDDEAGAERWVRAQERGRLDGDRISFAIVETAFAEDGLVRLEVADGPPVGHAVLKRPVPGGPAGEVGYWTAGHARGRGVASRALDALTDWAFTAFAEDGLVRLELLHGTDNTASCRVAGSCGYALTASLPAAPPERPRDAHLHTRHRPG